MSDDVSLDNFTSILAMTDPMLTAALLLECWRGLSAVDQQRIHAEVASRAVGQPWLATLFAALLRADAEAD